MYDLTSLDLTSLNLACRYEKSRKQASLCKIKIPFVLMSPAQGILECQQGLVEVKTWFETINSSQKRIHSQIFLCLVQLWIHNAEVMLFSNHYNEICLGFMMMHQQVTLHLRLVLYSIKSFNVFIHCSAPKRWQRTSLIWIQSEWMVISSRLSRSRTKQPASNFSSSSYESLAMHSNEQYPLLSLRDK